MKIKPLGDRVLIQAAEEKEKTKGGIILPDNAKEKPHEGKVIATGDGRKNEEGKVIPMNVKAGDKVLYGRYSGTEITVDDEQYIIMKEDEIVAIIQG